MFNNSSQIDTLKLYGRTEVAEQTCSIKNGTTKCFEIPVEESYPNTLTALCILLMIPVSIERSFSKLKLIKKIMSD